MTPFPSIPPRATAPAATTRRSLLCLIASIVLLLQAIPNTQAQTSATGAGTAGASEGSSGPIRLRQTFPADDVTNGGARPPMRTRPSPDEFADRPAPTKQAPERVSDFQAYVRKLHGGQDIGRFGVDLIEGLLSSADTADYGPLVPPDYALRAGDELVVTLWGSIDADLRLRVDRSGRIVIPRVGPVVVAGVRYAEVADVISRRVAQVFKNFNLSVTVGQLHGMRVYVTGFVRKPGTLVVNSLSTLAQAVMSAGGPSAAGSYRDVQLKRGREVVARMDLYDLLQRGDRSGDQSLQADDVIFVGPIGPQVAVLGSVNRPAIFEIRPSETVVDVLALAGGLSAVADRRRLTIERLEAGTVNRVIEVDLPAVGPGLLANGDVIRAFNAADVTKPTALQSKRVRVEGEVLRPGEYLMPPGSSLSDVMRAAGGVTQNAFLYATEFTRESVRQTQQLSYERALRDFETQATVASSTRRTTTAEEATALASASAASGRLIERLRALKPSGRVVLHVGPTSTMLPELAVEDGDRLYVPPRPSTVGVFGSVFSTGSYIYMSQRTVGDYLRLAGGPTRGADDGSVFVVRANGAVNSSLQESGYFSRGNQLSQLTVEPGDTIFVPEELNKSTWVQNAKDWTQILYQFGIGLAGIKSAVQ